MSARCKGWSRFSSSLAAKPYNAAMSRSRVNSLLGKSSLASIHERALWLAAKNECLARQLPLAINTRVTLVNIDTRRRAVLHVDGAEWATQIRLQQRMILAILKSCGIADVQSVLVKNRPASLEPLARKRKSRPARRLNAQTRDLICDTADGIKDERLRRSLRRLGRRPV